MNTPAETAARFLAVGREKVLLPVGRMACLAVMAGFLLAWPAWVRPQLPRLYRLRRRGWSVPASFRRGL